MTWFEIIFSGCTQEYLIVGNATRPGSKKNQVTKPKENNFLSLIL